MIRPFVALCAVAACIGLTAAPAAAAKPAALLPSVSCSGSTNTSVSTTGAQVTGSATCTGLATLSLATTVNANGVLSTVTGLLPALPNIPLPINVAIPAVGVSAACSVLTNVATGATVAASCST